MKNNRFIKLYPHMVVVCTIGPKGDGTDNIMQEFVDCKIITEYHFTFIANTLNDAVVATYNTEEIVCMATSKEDTPCSTAS